MCTFLLVYLLSIESSYLQNLERPAKDVGDTVQFCLRDGIAWRVKTFAIDHDVHVWNIGPLAEKELEALADENTQKHYGDVLRRRIKAFPNVDSVSLGDSLKKAGLHPYFEEPKNKQFAFWVPSLGEYRTKSTPK